MVYQKTETMSLLADRLQRVILLQETSPKAYLVNYIIHWWGTTVSLSHKGCHYGLARNFAKLTNWRCASVVYSVVSHADIVYRIW